VDTENRGTEEFYTIQHNRNLLSTVFSFSVPSSFLSSLFLSLPGASAIGKDEWNTNSFPAHSEAYIKIAAYKYYSYNSPFQVIIPIN
jgi:hypothetical protein